LTGEIVRFSSIVVGASLVCIVACTGGGADEYLASYDRVVHETCTCAEEVGTDPYDECVAAATAWSESRRACLRMASDHYPDEIDPTLECQAAAFDHSVECIRDLGCTSAAFDSCANLEDRLAACPDFPDIVDADLDACFDGG